MRVSTVHHYSNISSALGWKKHMQTHREKPSDNGSNSDCSWIKGKTANESSGRVRTANLHNGSVLSSGT